MQALLMKRKKHFFNYEILMKYPLHSLASRGKNSPKEAVFGYLRTAKDQNVYLFEIKHYHTSGISAGFDKINISACDDTLLCETVHPRAHVK